MMNRILIQLMKIQEQQCIKCMLRKPLRQFKCQYTTSNARELFHLKSRGLVQVKGKDAIPFLQGLVTSDLKLLDHQTIAQYSMLLNTKGRVMYDLLLYDISEGTEERNILMECEQNIADQVIEDIKRYRLRKKVAIENVSSKHAVLAASNQMTKQELPGQLVVTKDPRVPAFGTRIISENESLEGLTVSPCETKYHERRVEWGIPEGVHDLPPGNCTPLESNLTFMNGVSFSKGCYLGQELTARTHHTGEIRKRLVPLLFQKPPGEIESGENIINSKKKKVGKFRSNVGAYGLGLLRLADMSGELTVPTKSGETVNLKAVIPEWWPSNN